MPIELTPEQRKWINSARDLIDFLEAKPELIPEYDSVNVHVYNFARPQLSERLSALGAAEKYATDLHIGAKRRFGPHSVDVYAPRSSVCERKQVGEDVIEETVETVPEGAEVVDVVQRTVIRRTVPRYEVVCPPSLLGLADVAAAEPAA
jgi:hypothetical protein